MTDPRRMLAIAFGPATMAEALEGLPRIRAEADCVELRLDLFNEPFDLPTLLKERGDLPIVVTLRPPEEGGRSTLAPAERLEVLRSAAEQGAEYVDLEWDAATPGAIAQLRSVGAQVILSRHDFANMAVDGWWADLAERGADAVKVVGTARDVRDCLPILRMLEHASRPTIAIAMGQAGLLSRVLALRSEQCLLTYATLGSGTPTAPGQLTAHDMRATFHAGRLRSTTAVFGLLGPHYEQERLAEYNAWFTRDGLDAVAVPVVADSDAPGIVASFQELPVSGWHVHGDELQTTVGQALDELAASACHQGKVNAIELSDGSLVGHWVESPSEQYALWAESSLHSPA